MMACLDLRQFHRLPVHRVNDLRAGRQGVLERGAVSGATSRVFGGVFESDVKSLETGRSFLSRENT